MNNIKDFLEFYGEDLFMILMLIIPFVFLILY